MPSVKSPKEMLYYSQLKPMSQQTLYKSTQDRDKVESQSPLQGLKILAEMASLRTGLSQADPDFMKSTALFLNHNVNIDHDPPSNTFIQKIQPKTSRCIPWSSASTILHKKKRRKMRRKFKLPKDSYRRAILPSMVITQSGTDRFPPPPSLQHVVSEAQNEHEVSSQQSGTRETAFDIEHLELQQIRRKPHFGSVLYEGLTKEVGDFPVLTKQTNTTETVVDTDYLESPQLIPFETMEVEHFNKEFSELPVHSMQKPNTTKTMVDTKHLEPCQLMTCKPTERTELMKALIEPEVQKYVIDGFVIAESSAPFAVVFHSGLVDSPYRISPPKNYKDYILGDFRKKRKLEFGETEELQEKVLIGKGETFIVPLGKNCSDLPEDETIVFNNDQVKSFANYFSQIPLEEGALEFEDEFTVSNKIDFESSADSSDFSETQLRTNGSSGSDQIVGKHFTHDDRLIRNEKVFSESDDNITMPNKFDVELSEINSSDCIKIKLELLTDGDVSDDNKVEGRHLADSYNLNPVEEEASKSDIDTPVSNRFKVELPIDTDSTGSTKLKLNYFTDNDFSDSRKIVVEPITDGYNIFSTDDEAASACAPNEVSNKMDVASATHVYASDFNKLEVWSLTGGYYLIPVQTASASDDECTGFHNNTQVPLTNNHHPIQEGALESDREYTVVNKNRVGNTTVDDSSDSNTSGVDNRGGSRIIPMDEGASETDPSMSSNQVVIESPRDNPLKKDKPKTIRGLIQSYLKKKLPTKWTVQDVFMFIRSLPFCSEYASVFKSEDIDGRAFVLLKECHLVTVLGMKLGPALKLMSRIRSLKEETAEFKSEKL